MGILYAANQTNTALSTSADSVSLAAATNGPGSGILREWCVAGMATASAANEVALSRVTGGTIATAQVALNPGAATGLIFFGLAQGTTITTTLYRVAVNGNGAIFRWVAAPGMGVEYRAAATSERIGIRSISGTSNATTSTISEQI
jgi:hypothetical protein